MMQQTLDKDASFEITKPIVMADAPTQPQQRATGTPAAWGWGAALLALAGAVTLVAVALSGWLSRVGSDWAQPLFWVALLGMYALAVVVLWVCVPSRRGSLAVALVMTLVVSCVKVLLAPLGFAKTDEFMHLRTLADIAQSGHLFTPNTLLPVSAQFPGLELATNAIAQASGVSPFVAGMTLILCVRVVFALVVFRLGETLFGSPRLAALAVLIMLCNSQTLFYNTLFGYETLAVPLALLILYWALRRDALPQVPGYLLIATVAVTHHLTAYILTTLLLVWAAVHALGRRGRTGTQWSPLVPALAMLAAAAGWTLTFGQTAITYLSSSFHTNGLQLVFFFTGQSAARHLFTDYSGQAMAPWERAITLASVALMTLCVPLGCWEIWRKHRKRSVLVTLGLLALLYPIVQVMRLTPGGGEMAERLATFLFIGIAVIMITALTPIRRVVAQPLVLRLVGSAVVLLLFWGGVLLSGNPNWDLLPGPYLVNAEQRSIEPEGIDAATWTAQTLPPHQSVFADSTNRLLMSTIGGQNPQTLLHDKVDLSVIYLDAYLTDGERRRLRSTGVGYLVMDYRLTQQLPRLGIYFEGGEARQFRYAQTLPAAGFDKFDGAQGFDRAYDGGDIVIYRLNGA